MTLLVNNAGISLYQNLVTGELTRIRQELEVNLFGTLTMVRAFAPILAGNGGGAMLNVLSRMSCLSYPGATSYAVAKAAEWSLTNGIRLELAEHGTLVTGLFLSATDSDMMSGWDIPKSDPADVVRARRSTESRPVRSRSSPTPTRLTPKRRLPSMHVSSTRICSSGTRLLADAHAAAAQLLRFR